MPWDEVMHHAFARLRWTPDTFWRATPRELAAALGPMRAEPLPASELARLLRRFPDHPPTN